jgi:hypothetical protein
LKLSYARLLVIWRFAVCSGGSCADELPDIGDALLGQRVRGEPLLELAGRALPFLDQLLEEGDEPGRVDPRLGEEPDGDGVGLVLGSRLWLAKYA